MLPTPTSTYKLSPAELQRMDEEKARLALLPAFDPHDPAYDRAWDSMAEKDGHHIGPPRRRVRWIGCRRGDRFGFGLFVTRSCRELDELIMLVGPFKLVWRWVR